MKEKETGSVEEQSFRVQEVLTESQGFCSQVQLWCEAKHWPSSCRARVGEERKVHREETQTAGGDITAEGLSESQIEKEMSWMWMAMKPSVTSRWMQTFHLSPLSWQACCKSPDTLKRLRRLKRAK